MSLTEQTTRVLRRLEEVVLETLRQHGISRSALGDENLLDITGATVRRKLVPDRPEGQVPPDVTVCLRALEVCGVDGMEVLGGLCSSGAPEVLLSAMPVPGFDRAEEQKAKRRKGYQRRRRLLGMAETLEAAIPRDDPASRHIWPVRRLGPELGRVYEELDELEEERHRDREAVEEVCEEVLAGPHESLSFAEAVRRVGLLGLWGSVQRSAQRLYFARDALALGTSLARRLGDESLLATQLQRSASILGALGERDAAESILQEVVVRCHADQYRDGVGYALVQSAALALNSGSIASAQRLYLAALEQLTESARPLYRVLIAQGVAACREHHGDLEGALAYLASIGASEETYDHPQLRAAVLLTSGNIQRRLGRLAAAARSYREALGNLEGSNDRRSELKVYLDLSVCLVKAGDREGWREAATQVQAILPELDNQSHLQTQCVLLLRELRSEHVSIEALEDIRARL